MWVDFIYAGRLGWMIGPTQRLTDAEQQENMGKLS
jgi:hypothetical protein